MSRKRPPVVMIHGGFCGPWAFEDFAEKFTAAGYLVECPALRFHDMDPPPEALGTTGLIDYAADLEELVAALTLPPILIGHSLGGLLAQMLAARRPAHALILLAPAAPWGVAPSTLLEIAAAQNLLLKVGYWKQLLPPDTEGVERHAFNRFPAEERGKWTARLIPESGRATFEMMHWGLDMSRASEVDPANVSCPLLVLVGSEDRINSPGTVERVAGLYRGRAICEQIPGMSHWLMGEPGWETVAARALEWLDGI